MWISEIIADHPYCIQLTNECLACDALWVSENLLSGERTDNSKLWDWNLLVILYSAHRWWLGLWSIASLQESDIMWTIENIKLWDWNLLAILFQIIADQPYCIQLINDCLACDALWVPENLLSGRQLTTVSSGIGISWSYGIQLTDSGLVYDPLRVSKNLIKWGHLKIVSSGIGISWPYCIQFTNSCLVCNGLRVSKILTICWQLTVILEMPYHHAEEWYQFHNNPASLWQTHDIMSGIFSGPSTVLQYASDNQFTNSCLACDGLWVSKNLTICW